MADLFASAADSAPAAPALPGAGTGAAMPLAERLRPASLAEVVGQEHLTGPEGAIGRMVTFPSRARTRISGLEQTIWNDPKSR